MDEIPATHNQFAYSVSEISQALKRVVEDNFGLVRVRGEISGWRGPHSSGHAYFRLKDEKAVLEAVCWRGTLGKIPVKIEEGLEVIATGRVTTYPGSSKYQIVIESMEPAGIGALMAMLEKLKQKLAAEGLFDEKRKKKLPFLPQVIGVVTSPTGAVIRDILHRLSDRFPCHVIVWPVAVQGEDAGAQIARAIEGFNNLSPDVADLPGGVLHDDPAKRGGAAAGAIPRPHLIIVARGGGSLEDLWAFNEEVVVRAAAASKIPLISAVGHETDTTLIDYASDWRAPTPTAAAEIALPVREEWIFTMEEKGKRLLLAVMRLMRESRDAVAGLARGLPHPGTLIETAMQKLDDKSERLAVALPAMLARKDQALAVARAKLMPRNLFESVIRSLRDVAQLTERAHRQWRVLLDKKAEKLAAGAQLLEGLSPLRILERGYVLVESADKALVTRASAMKPGAHTLVFHDGRRKITTE